MNLDFGSFFYKLFILKTRFCVYFIFSFIFSSKHTAIGQIIKVLCLKGESVSVWLFIYNRIDTINIFWKLFDKVLLAYEGNWWFQISKCILYQTFRSYRDVCAEMAKYWLLQNKLQWCYLSFKRPGYMNFIAVILSFPRYVISLALGVQLTRGWCEYF